MSNSIAILGLHHITIVCANAQRTLDFYTIERGLPPLSAPVWHAPQEAK